MWARIQRDWWVWLFVAAFAAWIGGLLTLLGGEARGLWVMVGGAAVLGCGMLYLFTVHGGDPDGKPDTGAPVMLIDGVFQTAPAPLVLPERMTKAAYADYLRSPHWQQTRQRKLDEVGRRCQLCGRTHRINVHHNSYANLGHESMNDLIVLCSGCHEHFHAGRKVG